MNSLFFSRFFGLCGALCIFGRFGFAAQLGLLARLGLFARLRLLLRLLREGEREDKVRQPVAARDRDVLVVRVEYALH